MAFSIPKILHRGHALVGIVFTALAVSCLAACDNSTIAERVEAATHKENYKFKPDVVLKVGYDNNEGEAFDLGLRHWKAQLERRSHGLMTLELYPKSTLGTQGTLMKMIDNGEPVCTIADGALFYNRGLYDMGIVFGPYLFKNWDEAFRLANSSWYKKESEKLAEQAGLRIISPNWAYGVRHLLTTKPVRTIKDFESLTLRVPANPIQERGLEIFGAKTVNFQLTEVNDALRSGKIDGLENPIHHLYGGGYYKNAKHLLLTGHVFNFTNLVVSEKFWQSLDSAQQRILVETCNDSAKFFNTLQEADEYTTIKKLEAEGVEVTRPNPELLQALTNSSHAFYVLPDFNKVWSPSLYYKILAAKTVPRVTHYKLRKQQEAQKQPAASN